MTCPIQRRAKRFCENARSPNCPFHPIDSSKSHPFHPIASSKGWSQVSLL